MKKVLFIGNRPGVYQKVQSADNLNIVQVFALSGSLLSSYLRSHSTPHVDFLLSEREMLFDRILAVEFDILISNGCPFILPVSRIKRPGQIYLNVHPSLLPVGRGRHPVNEVLLRGYRHYGATMHYIDDGIDTGRIIHQERLLVTDDLDLGLLYRLVFEAEAKVFENGMLLLANSDFVMEGQSHAGDASYYTRKSSDQIIDFTRMTDMEIVRRVRAFGISTQGANALTSEGHIKVFAAEVIGNSDLRAHYHDCEPGEVLLEYDKKLLVRSCEGIIKVTSFEKED